MRDGAILRVGELKLVLRMYDRGELADGADEPYVTSARRSKAGQGRGDGLGAPYARRDPPGEEETESKRSGREKARVRRTKREKRKTGGGDGMARGKIDTDKREDETAVYKPVKPKKSAVKAEAPKEEKKTERERPNAMSRNCSSFPAGKSGKRRALPPSPETDGAPSAARAMRA